MLQCSILVCKRPAVGAVGLELFPHQAMMTYYKCNKRITRLLLDLPTCDECFASLDIAILFPAEKLEPMIKVIERSTGNVVDRKNFKLVRVELNDKDYLVLKGMQAAQDKPQHAR